ncbi:hypothetical protein BS47DRAFT_1287152 [Hydnum rufescens UP504]|uniref:NAD-dependent epimerase/dehydratase domain-containing protein n=1 Tax=Hydnum rufescens UP504 TaxID=1448309 RepID=A0A9P6B9K8_9AGAM|nr:hypothetical protein BS47DRAFT_1287152 [Hydnum rufescens UP504]
MTPITSGKLLITGKSGYVGAWIVKCAVDRGYSVIAAVRTDAHGQFLVNRFPEYHGKVSYLIPVIEKDGAYDEGVKDVGGITHTTSPVIFRWGDPRWYQILPPSSTYGTSARLVIQCLAFQTEVLRPAIRGALGILESAHRYGRTSSASLWNTPATTQLEALGKDTNPSMVYAARKTYAEQSSWAWVKEHRPSWDLVTILLPFIWGPYIHKPHFGSSPGRLLENVLDRSDTSCAYAGDCADVRDTADIHVLALENPDAGGERVLIGTGESIPWSSPCCPAC